MVSWVAPVLAAELQEVNINTATLEELTSLNGIGEKVAARIIAYRKKHGDFEYPEDLIRVKGIGQILFERNRDRITVD